MSRIIDLLIPVLPADAWLELANQLGQWRVSNGIEEGDCAQRVCEILSSEVQS